MNNKIDTRRDLLNRAFIYAIAISFAVIIFLEVRPLLFDIFVAFVLSIIAEPSVNKLEGKLKRNQAALIVLLAILALIIGTLLSIVPIMVTQLYELSLQIPNYIENIVTSLENSSFINFEINNQNLDYESQFTNLFEKYGGTVGNTVVFASQGIIEGLGHIIVIFLFTFYLISDGNKWRAALRNNLSSSFWKIIDEVWNVGVSKAAGFTVAKFILGVFASLVLSIGFLFVGLPSAIALGVAAGILSQLIPVVGTFIGGLVPFVASISLGTNKMIATILIVMLYQVVENYYISPKVTQKTMSVHPGIAIFATLFGAYTIGPVGAILALPVAATIQGLIATYIHSRKIRR